MASQLVCTVTEAAAQGDTDTPGWGCAKLGKL